MLQRILLVLTFLFLASPAMAGFTEAQKAYDSKEWNKALDELKPLVDGGDDRAMILMANMYNDGFGVPHDRVLALSLYKRAAVEKNNPEAMLAVAAMHTSGLGTPINLTKAMEWFRRAALLGDQIGAFFYATILFRGNQAAGDDIKPDFYNSYKWFKIAAKSPQNPKFQTVSEEVAKRLADQKLTPAEAVKAAEEAAAWKPVDAASLGPVPADPVPVQSTPAVAEPAKAEEKKP